MDKDIFCFIIVIFFKKKNDIKKIYPLKKPMAEKASTLE